LNSLNPEAPTSAPQDPLVVMSGQGRRYEMNGLSAVFLADGAETGDAYSISEWWLEPHTKGPGAHAHDEDDVFYVLEGTVSFLVGEKWFEAAKGAFVKAPGGLMHDFENRSDARAGVLNLSFPGGFERNMPMIVDWFAQHPPGRA